MEKANWEKRIKSTGEIFEIIGTYTEVGIMNPPAMLSDKDEKTILKIMAKNRIKKLEIIV